MAPPTGLFKFHRPRPNIAGAPIPKLSEESRKCLKNLAHYRSKLPQHTSVPRACRAAVLVALFVGRYGDLYVLLSRRSSTLRTYAGDTSLPGGKVEPGDRTIEDTARREAFEEIGLPINRIRVPLLCVLDPFLAGDSLVVTPVVVLILDNTLRPILNTPEVASLFSHPLAAFLTTVSPFPMEPLFAPELGAEHPEHREYYGYVDVTWPFGFRSNEGAYSASDSPSTASGSGAGEYVGAHAESSGSGISKRSQREKGKERRAEKSDDRENVARGHVRQHRFLTGREAGGVKPVFGLTAAILIQTATIAHARPAAFPVYAPDQPSMTERIEWAAAHSPRILAARWREGEKGEAGAEHLLSGVPKSRSSRLEADLFEPELRGRVVPAGEMGGDGNGAGEGSVWGDRRRGRSKL